MPNIGPTARLEDCPKISGDDINSVKRMRGCLSSSENLSPKTILANTRRKVVLSGKATTDPRELPLKFRQSGRLYAGTDLP